MTSLQSILKVGKTQETGGVTPRFPKRRNNNNNHNNNQSYSTSNGALHYFSNLFK